MLPIEPPSRLVPEPRPVGITEPVEMLRVSGDVYSVPDSATLQRWILERRVSPEDMVSQHGMRWVAIGDRPEFALFFQAADRLAADPQPLDDLDPELEAPRRRELPMADDEQIYVQELPPEAADPPTALEPQPEPEPALPALRPSPTLSPHPFRDEPTIHASEPPPVVGPLDELPANLLVASRVADDPTRLLDVPPPVPFQMEARSLGFKLDPDPDTQEETLRSFDRQEIEQAHDPTDSFMLTGVIPGSSDYRPPPVHIDGGVPRTVQPRTPSVLDDEPEPPPKRSGGAAPEYVIGGLFVGAALIALAGWMFTRTPEAPAEAPKPEVAAAAPLPPPPPPANPEDEAARKAAQAAAMAEPFPGDELPAEPAPEPAKAAPAPEPAKPAPPPEPKPAPKPVEKPAPAVARAPTPEAPAAPKPAAKAEATGGGSARSLTDAGWKAIDKGDLEGAHGFFARALQKDPRAGWALYGRGYANEKLGDKISAGSDYCAAQAAAASDPELGRELAGGLRRLGKGC
jgi:hypothetical protein